MKITLISTTESPQEQGIRTISSVLKKKEHDVKIVFMASNKTYSQLYSKKELQQLKKICENSGLIGINCFANTFPKAVQVIKFLKQLRIPIIFGGIHPTLAPEECIKYVNILCIGEGEGAIVELVNYLEKKKPIDNIKNLWVKKGQKIIKNPVRFLIDDLDSIPTPDFEIGNHYILDKGAIRKFNEKDFNKQIIFLTSRGCPFGCTYCSNSKYNRIYINKCMKIVRHHSNDYVINHLKCLINKFESLNSFDLRDDSFTLRNIEEIKDFSKKYKREIGINLKISVEPRTLNEAKIKSLVNAGCVDIIMGIEGSERVNKEIYKRFIDNGSILKSTKILNKYKNKISVSYDVLANNPYETSNDILDLINFVKKFPKPFRLFPNNLIFFKGSELYDIALSDGTIKTFKDTAINLKYTDRARHILLRKKNIYGNIIINLMRGLTTENKYGSLSKRTLNYLIDKERFKKYSEAKIIPLLLVYNLLIFDFVKYKILKPIYQNMFYSFRHWYVKRIYGGKIHYTERNI